VNKVTRKRVSLSLRLQPYEGDPIAEVTDYLNSLSKDVANRKVADILVAALLPLARYVAGTYTQEQLRFACWESQDAMNKHGTTMRFAMGVEQPQFVHDKQVAPTSTVAPNANPAPVNALINSTFDDDEGESKMVGRPNALIQGKASSSDVDSLFG
jgi:hypothetical protein